MNHNKNPFISEVDVEYADDNHTLILSYKGWLDIKDI